MKSLRNKILFAAVTLLLLLSTVNVAVAQGDHDEHDNVESNCHDADQMVRIGTDPAQLAFNVTEVEVDKGACVMFMFKNHQDTEHDFVLHAENGTELFGLHIMNSTSHVKSVMWQMPNEDTELEFWCTVVGHKDAGMEGVVIVGEGNEDSLPGFGFIAVFLAFAIAIPVLRKRRVN